MENVEFSEQASDDENLKLAVKITNRYLNCESFYWILKINFHANFEILRSKLLQGKIVYAHPDDGKKILAWTDRTIYSETIYVNQIFQQRLKKLKNIQSKSEHFLIKERETIIVFFSFLLIHEIGHLALRWKGIIDSPLTLTEAGLFLENKLFGGTIHLLLGSNNEWDSDSEIIGISLHKSFGKNNEINFQLSYRSFINKMYNLTLSFDLFMNPVFLKKILKKDAHVMKTEDEELDMTEEEQVNYFDIESLGVLKCGLIKPTK